MKTVILLASLATGIASAFTLYPAPDNPEKEKAIVSTAINALSGLHYEPAELDDEFSGKVYRLYLDRLDGARRFFIREDVDALAPYRYQLDDELEASELGFFDATEERLTAAMARSQRLYREILAEPFDFTLQENLELDGDKKPFPATEADLRESWRKALKWEAMTRLNDKLELQRKLREGPDEDEEALDGDASASAAEDAEAQEEDEDEDEREETDEELLAKTPAELEADARADVLKSFDDYYERNG